MNLKLALTVLLMTATLAAADMAVNPLPLTNPAKLPKTALSVKLPDGAKASAGAISDEIWVQGYLLEVRQSLENELDAEAYVNEQKEDPVLTFVDEIGGESTETSYTYMYTYKVGSGNPVIALIKVMQLGNTVYTCKGTTGSPDVAYTYRDICDSLKQE